MYTIYEAMGGAQGVRALAAAWHERCLADPVVSHPFENGVRADHVERLAAYWTEQLGGPADYTALGAGHSDVVREHTGNGPHEHMDGRAVACFVLALDDAGIPPDPKLRFALVGWFTWATALLNHRWARVEDVPDNMPIPQWTWEGTEGW